MGILKIDIVLIILLAFIAFLHVADAKRRVQISDDLDDVIDDEEDDSFREWGIKKKQSPPSDLPPPDFSDMSISDIQQIMSKMSSGPVFGFAKLRLGVPRTPENVGEIARKWTKLSRTGGIEVRFTGVDLSTVMFNMDEGSDKEELKEFVLNQEEAYEVKIGDHVFRRPGDPPLEEVVEELQRKRHVADESTKVEL